jgi:hypothetical protein
MTMYFQCKMRRGNAETVAWIEERGAKVGAEVELTTADGECCKVVEVWQPGMEEEALRAKQAADRNSLPSKTRKAGR